MKWWHALTGGRPMRVIHPAFRDVVSGRQVYRMVDAFGRGWLAERPWSRFRVESSYSSEIWDPEIVAAQRAALGIPNDQLG